MKLIFLTPTLATLALGALTMGMTGASAQHVRLSPDERQSVRTIITQEPACRYEPRLDFSIGIPLPRSVRVCEFPESIVTEVPSVRRYRYLVRGDEIVVVDPEDYQVIDVIE